MQREKKKENHPRFHSEHGALPMALLPKQFLHGFSSPPGSPLSLFRNSMEKLYYSNIEGVIPAVGLNVAGSLRANSRLCL